MNISVEIRQVARSDFDEYFAYVERNATFLAPYQPYMPPESWTEAAALQRFKDDLKVASRREWVITVDGLIQGRIALSNITRGAYQSANLGYSVDERCNGRGVATRAAQLVLNEAFTEMGLHRVEAGTLVDNFGSQRVLEKNGFLRIGLARYYLKIAGAWRDHILFAITREDHEAPPQR